VLTGGLVGGALVAACVTAVTGQRRAALAAPVLGLAALCFARVRVTIDAGAVRVVLGPLPLLRATVRLDEIAGAEEIRVRPLVWGGWGWRWVPWRRATAIVLRSGEGILLRRRGGRELLVTVDRAAEAATVVRNAAHLT
jgi:hypothetical protein